MYNLSLHPANSLRGVEEFFAFNQIPYRVTEIWNTNANAYLPDETISDCVLIIGHEVFETIISYSVSFKQLCQFLKNNNYLWVMGNTDISFRLLNYKKILIELDKAISKQSITILSDAVPSNRCFFSQLKNIIHYPTPIFDEFFILGPRIYGAVPEKKANSKDFLLTTIIKKRYHRKLLKNELGKHNNLLKNSIVSLPNQRSSTEWLGKKSLTDDWHDGFLSMDLYNNAYVEIVPETMYKDLYQPSEKTWKPIIAKTPFIALSNAYYLDFLKKHFGFKTFSHLINEEYDQHYRVEDRVKKIIETMQDIQNNGAKSFYDACQDILDYNFNKYCEIYGKQQVHFDQTLYSMIESLNNQ